MSVPRAPTSKASIRPLGSVDAADLSAVRLRKTLRIGRCFQHSSARLLAELDAEVHLHTPDPASYTLHHGTSLYIPHVLLSTWHPILWRLFWNHLCQVSTLYQFIMCMPHKTQSRDPTVENIPELRWFSGVSF